MRKRWLAMSLLLRIHQHLAKCDFNIRVSRRIPKFNLSHKSATDFRARVSVPPLADLWLIFPNPCYIYHSNSQILLSSSFSMPGARKRAPSTPKRTSKRSKTQEKRSELPGGALQTSFRLQGESLIKQSIHKLTLQSDALQTAGPSRHVHFAVDTLSAVPGPSAGPSHLGGEVEDPFFNSIPIQPPNQVSEYFIEFLYTFDKFNQAGLLLTSTGEF